MSNPIHNVALPEDLLDFAKYLRAAQTDPEQIFWAMLRGRRFFGLKFRRQHPIPPYVLDFYCHKFRWAIELDGVQHETEKGRLHDENRAKFLSSRGIHVTRISNSAVRDNFSTVLQSLVQTMHELRDRTP